jgi:hypothetical protein
VIIVASYRVPSDVPSAKCSAKNNWDLQKLPHRSDLLSTLTLRETSTANCKKSASNFKAMAFVWLLWLTVPTLLSNELFKLKRNCRPFQKLFKSYCEYKDGQMPGKHGWHDGSIHFLRHSVLMSNLRLLMGRFSFVVKMAIWKHIPRARRSPSKASFIHSFIHQVLQQALQ